jgi:hypothetical protein
VSRRQTRNSPGEIIVGISAIGSFNSSMGRALDAARNWLALPEAGMGIVVHDVHRERDY